MILQKSKLITIITILGITFSGCSNTKTTGIENYEEYCEEHNIINLSTTDNTPESLSGINRHPEDAQEKVVEAFDGLPDHIEDFYMDEHGKILIVDDESNNLSWAGQYTPRNDEIKIKKNSYDIKVVLYHEIGHMIDFKYKNFIVLSNTREFKEIYEEEKDNFKVDHSNPEYFRNNRQEYFAQAFSEYLINPERLKKNCPKTYEFIKYNIDNQYMEVELCDSTSDISKYCYQSYRKYMF